MARRQNKKREESLRKEVEEIERKVDESIALDKKILSEQELKSLQLVQNSNGGTAVPTDNTILQGTTGNFSAVPSGGVLPAGKSVNFAADNPNVVLSAGTPDAAGNPTVNVAVPDTEPLGTFNLNANVVRTDGTTISAPPLVVKIVGTPPPPPTELTGLSLVQNS